MIEARARLKSARISEQKARLVADMVRGLPVGKAVEILKFTNKKAAKLIRGVLDSATANAEHTQGADIDELKVSAITVDKGPMLKRMQPRAKGRGARILKRSCHITVTLSDEERD